jgi:hypothetical protein
MPGFEWWLALSLLLADRSAVGLYFEGRIIVKSIEFHAVSSRFWQLWLSMTNIKAI